MTVRVLFFGVLADRIGVRETAQSIGDGADVANLLGVLARIYPDIASVRDKLAVAVNLEYVKKEHALTDGDEVAVIPPVSGG